MTSVFASPMFREEARQVDGLAEGLGGLVAAVDAEGDHPAVAVEVFGGVVVALVVLEAGVRHPIDPVVVLEELGDGPGVLAVALHPGAGRVEPLNRLPRVERRLAGPVGRPAAGRRCRRRRRRRTARRSRSGRRGLPVEFVVVGVGGWSHGNWPPSTTMPPTVVPLPVIHFVVVDSPNDVGAVLERPTEGGVANVLSTTSGTAFSWAISARAARSRGRDERRVRDRFDVDERGVVVDRVRVRLVVERVDESGLDSAAVRDAGEVRGRAAVHLGTGDDDVVARAREHGRYRVERGHPEPVATASEPPDRSAIRSSRTLTVGLESRE